MPDPDLTCLLIADDLTGACDAGVQFAKRGFETAVRLWGMDGADGAARSILALSTESRALPVKCLPGIFDEAARRLPGAQLIFKKIDSTLRGNVGAEIALATEAFRCDAAVITPAFPAMGRTVEDGVLRVRDRAPIEMAAYWREQNLRRCVHRTCAELSDALATGARFVSLDASCNEELDGIAESGLASNRRILWAGSAGLAAALARSLPRQSFETARRGGTGTQPLLAGDSGPRAAAPVLFCIGSNHSATVEQARRLCSERPTLAVDTNTADPVEIAAALENGRHVSLWTPCGRVTVERIACLIGETRAPILATGGFTASLVWRALGMREIQLETEIAPGIPLGVIRGGKRDGAPLVTKSGGFGDPEALVGIADYFCPL